MVSIVAFTNIVNFVTTWKGFLCLVVAFVVIVKMQNLLRNPCYELRHNKIKWSMLYINWKVHGFWEQDSFFFCLGFIVPLENFSLIYN